MADIRPEIQIKQIKDELEVYKSLINLKRVFFNPESEVEEFFETRFDETTTTREAYEAGFLDALEIAVNNIEMMMEKEWE